MKDEKEIIAIVNYLDQRGFPYFLAVSTGENHGDDGKEIVMAYNNLKFKSQFEAIEEMIDNCKVIRLKDKG